MAVAEALEMANLANWDVSVEPMMALPRGSKCEECSAPLNGTHDEMCAIGDHEGLDFSRKVLPDDCVVPLPVHKHRAVVRTNPFTGEREVLSVGGVNYTPISNEIMGATLQAILDDSGAIVDTAGSLRGGLDTFITARMPKGILVGGVDAVEMNIAGLNYFEPGRSSEFLITPVRVVCANTQAAALANFRSRWTFRHSPTAPARVSEAREKLGITFDYVDAFSAEAEKMINAQLTIADLEKVCREIWPAPDKDATDKVRERDADFMRLIKKVFKGETNANIGKGNTGSHWSGWATLTEVADHWIDVPGDAENANTVRAERALLGATARIKSQAFKLLQVA
ncbi:phage/plasmid-like protein (TIGR03299 family) [Actinokineospora baliensis]|nr:phage/plasmid-like protein (TIGR03299 family) [Actinokineospora baliensis]